MPHPAVAVAAGLITGAATALAVEISLVVFAVAARAYHLQPVKTISVPATISAAALRGAQFAPLVFAVSGLLTAFAFTLSRPGRGHGRPS